jgi:hypothetical protein
MTLPRERFWALENTKEFLRSLLDPKKTPRIPLSVRRSARGCLKHFPTELDIERICKKCPEVITKED